MKKENVYSILRYISFGLSALLIIAGMALGQPDTVLYKAINICLECVGIG
ncbi:MAG: hypothetical protein IJ137_09210 [Eubacterium sp.]|nr:hypothetical protein [Eubacterium sp.]